jgi:hypothetical protein
MQRYCSSSRGCVGRPFFTNECRRPVDGVADRMSQKDDGHVGPDQPTGANSRVIPSLNDVDRAVLATELELHARISFKKPGSSLFRDLAGSGPGRLIRRRPLMSLPSPAAASRLGDSISMAGRACWRRRSPASVSPALRVVLYDNGAPTPVFKVRIV